MKKFLRGFSISAGIYASYLAFPQESKALGFVDLPYPSKVMKWDCILSPTQIVDDRLCIRDGYPPLKNPPHWQRSEFIWWEWDPPVNDITSISFEFSFNPSRFTPIVDSAGFLCSFTSSGNCPVELPGVGTQLLTATTTPPITGPANGTQSIIVGSSSVNVNATFSSPITAESDELFFAMAFEPLFEIPDNAHVIYSQELLPDADYSVTSYTCTTLDNQNSCGSDNYTVSGKVIVVPEPTSTLSLLSLGIVGVGATLKRKVKRKVKRSHSIEKEPTNVG